MTKDQERQALDDYWNTVNRYIEVRKKTLTQDHMKLYFDMKLGEKWTRCYELGLEGFP